MYAPHHPSKGSRASLSTARLNVIHKRTVHTSERSTRVLCTVTRSLPIEYVIIPQRTIEFITHEARVNLAIEAIENDENLCIRAVAKIYNVSYTTLIQRRARRLSRRDILANLRKFTNLEERAIV